jgi:TetR/AcrR family transcriptional regulator, transcriptional repressor for nem operon
MNRPRHFDLERLRECVTDVFVKHGYRGTSMSMLTEASGLGKQSLYNALGDKEAAYLQALECASQRYAGLQSAMQDAPDGRRAVHRFFAQVIEVSASTDPAHNVCMLTAGLMEGIEAEAITTKLQEKWHALCNLMQLAIERGQQDGSIRRDVASDALCALLVTLMAGIRVSAKAPTDRVSLETTVRWALKLLDEGSPAP